ncbi:MAG: transposase [Paraglaciecola sp.]|uniref:transposase n=1 Tax=Paraglaciecola sp. TaxID=1920173 RepID=UPI003296DC8F
MKRSKRPTYSPEFRLETAQLVVDQNYSQEEAVKAMSVAPSTISKWVSQLKQERKGIQVKQLPMTPDESEMRYWKYSKPVAKKT